MMIGLAEEMRRATRAVLDFNVALRMAELSREERFFSPKPKRIRRCKRELIEAIRLRSRHVARYGLLST